jgi:pyrroline-5-carboxylate reductase
MLEQPASLAVIGCGTMGAAFVEGLVHTGAAARASIVATARRADVAEALAARLGVETGTDNAGAIERARVVLLCLKPQRLPEVLQQPAIRRGAAGKLVVSIAAGITLTQLRGLLPESTLVRAMPNTPCLIGEGMTVVARGADVSDEQMAVVTRIFSSVGRCLELEEKHMDAVTSLGGSGPAFAYVMLEALADGGVMMGLPRDVALTIAAQVFLGSAKMVLQTELHPAALKDQVTTPAGSTIAGLLVMEDGRIRSVLARAIQEATRVAAQLGARSSS